MQFRLRSAWRPLVGAVALGSLALAGIFTASAQDHTPLEDPIPEPIEEGAVTVALQPVADGMTAPTWGTSAPGCSALASWLFVADQDGILWGVNTAAGTKTAMADLSSLLVDLGIGGPGTYDERGFLGVALHPDFATNGLLYTYTSEPVAGPADFSTMPTGEAANHQTVIREWQKPDPCNPGTVVDPGTMRELLRIDQPQFNHNGGTVAFGPDGYLYISLGDGGAADDQGVGHVPGGNGQEPGNILGSIIRIDPQGTNSANGEYGIPAGNPFVGAAGVDEIFNYGFRNPFRFSFDSDAGDMYIADVGQNDIEEVDLGVLGGNYGWNIKEGSFCFDPNGDDPGFVYECGPGDDTAGLIDPIAEYDHDEGVAIVGGFVYRGDAIPQLKGRYVFGDFSDPDTGAGRLLYLHANGEIRELDISGQDNLGLSLLGFGQGADGEIYVLANSTGTPFGDTGVVLRLGREIPGRAFYSADLAGENEVPPVATPATGTATFSYLGVRGDILTYNLRAFAIDNVVAAHIHCAPEGVNGPIGATLFSGGPTNGPVFQDRGAVVPDPDNACNWMSVADIVNAIESGNAYVNVHTTEHPGGEIRGQIEPGADRPGGIFDRPGFPPGDDEIDDDPNGGIGSFGGRDWDWGFGGWGR